MTEAIAELWQRYEAHRDPEARGQLLNRYMGLVYHVARKLDRRLPEVEFGDLIGAGTLGLMQALETFDRSRGVAFSTYAVQRIRGAILDDLRSRDWVPRSVRARARRLADARRSLAARYGRPAEAHEVAREVGIDITTLWRWEDEIDGAELMPFDCAVPGSDTPMSLEQLLSAPEPVMPDAEIVVQEELTELHEAIAELPARERQVLSLYFHKERTLRQIGGELGVTEGRVSQIRTRALLRLRDRLQGFVGGELAHA